MTGLSSNQAMDAAAMAEWRRLGAIDKADNLVRLCSPYPHKRILDIGAGDGAVVRRLIDVGFSGTFACLEITPEAVSRIRGQNIPAVVECRQFDGHTIPYGDGSFDLAILCHVLEHVAYPRQLLYEAGRVARCVFVEVPLEDNLRLKKDYIPDSVGHINAFSFKSIRRLIQSSGFEAMEQIVTNPSYRLYRYQFGVTALPRYLVKGLVLRLAAPLASHLWSYHCSLICRPKRP